MLGNPSWWYFLLRSLWFSRCFCLPTT